MDWLCLWHGEDVRKNQDYPQCFLDMTDETGLLGDPPHDQSHDVGNDDGDDGEEGEEDAEDAYGNEQDSHDDEMELDKIIELCEENIARIELNKSGAVDVEPG